MKKVAVILGSASDLPKIEKTFTTLEEYGVPYEANIFSAHRTPDEAAVFAAGAREAGFGVIIAAAGMAAHLAGALAARTTLPVIGVPVSAAKLDGMDALLSTVQMPSGIPVASVAIDGGVNAALLAVEILSLSEPSLSLALDGAREAAKEKVLSANREIEEKYNK